jgi:hypothetical protein
MAHLSCCFLVVARARATLPKLCLGAFALLFSSLALVSGCGHPASVAECEEIVERITRLELEERQIAKDPNAVAAEVAETKTAMRDRMMKDCHGKRVTNRAMRCVREATSSKKVEECFD